MEIDGATQQGVVDRVLAGQNLPNRCLEGSPHVGVVFGAGLKIRTAAVLLAPRPGLVFPDLAFLLVHLVSEHHEGKALGVSYVRIIHELFLPAAQVLEALQVVHGKREQAAVRPAVEGRAQALEALLARRVPNLEGDQPAVYFEVTVEELHADGVEGLGIEAVGHVAVHEGTFPHAAIPQQNDLQ